MLRRLLRLDQPTPPRTSSEIAAEVKQNYRWNFTVNLLDGVSFWFGLNIVSAATIIPLYVSKLTDSTVLIGLIAVLAQAGWFLPQIFVAGFTEQISRKKSIVINLGFFTERLPMWLWPLSALLVPFSPVLALVVFFWGYAWHHVGTGLIGPAWQDLIARCFPVHRRGRFFGTTTFIGTGTGALGALLSGWLLETYPFPLNFTLIFLIAAVAVNISWAFLSLTREPVQPVEPPPADKPRLRAKLQKIIKADINFKDYLIARVLLAFGSMGLGFVTVSAVQRLQVSDSVVGFYTVALLLGQTTGNLAAGWLADRTGHKGPLEVAGLCSAAAFGMAWLAPTAGWYYVIFLLLGVSIGAGIVSGTLIALEFSQPEQRPTYVGLANTAVGLGNAIAPLVGGWLAGFSYGWLFALSSLLSVIGVAVMRFKVRDPRTTTAN
jgi:MFS family permease